jgi:hypothetical protein
MSALDASSGRGGGACATVGLGSPTSPLTDDGGDGRMRNQNGMELAPRSVSTGRAVRHGRARRHRKRCVVTRLLRKYKLVL